MDHGIEITVKASDVQHARALLRDFLSAGGTSDETAPPVVEANPAPAKRTTARKAKAAEPEQAVTDIDENGDAVPDEPAKPDEPAEPATDTPTLDDVKEMLKALMSAAGENAVWELLGKYKVKNASGLLESDKCAEAIAEAKALIEGAE